MSFSMRGVCHIFRMACVLMATLAMPQAQANSEVDPFALASMLIRDGHFSRAELVLAKVQKSDVDEPHRWNALRGMIALHKKDYPSAEKLFLQSLKASSPSEEVSLYLAEVYVKTTRYPQARVQLQKIRGPWSQKLPYHLLRADVAWQLGERLQGWAILEGAKKTRAWVPAVTKKQFSFLLADGVYQYASSVAFTFLDQGGSSEDVAAMASQFLKHDESDLALKLLEGARLRDPGHTLVGLELVEVYLKRKSTFSAALLLEELSRHHPSLSFEASELLRQAGKSYRARLNNMLIGNPKKKLKQQMALFLETEDFDSLNQLYPQMRSHALLENEEIRYAMAYSFFKSGEFKKSESLLARVQDAGLFEKAVELRKEILKCVEETWSCSETI